MASPSPPSRRVVDYAYVDALPTFMEKVEIIFSDAEIRYQTAEERRALSRIVIRHLAVLRGGHCIRDLTMRTCRRDAENGIRDPGDLHFHHRPGTTKLYHIRDYQHCIKPVARRRNLQVYLNEAMKCDPICWRHHVSFHTLRALGCRKSYFWIYFWRPQRIFILFFTHNHHSLR
jgi:hypothetical protein